jgi:hypothetical protein
MQKSCCARSRLTMGRAWESVRLSLHGYLHVIEIPLQGSVWCLNIAQALSGTLKPRLFV